MERGTRQDVGAQLCGGGNQPHAGQNLCGHPQGL